MYRYGPTFCDPKGIKGFLINILKRRKGIYVAKRGPVIGYLSSWRSALWGTVKDMLQYPDYSRLLNRFYSPQQGQD